MKCSKAPYCQRPCNDRIPPRLSQIISSAVARGVTGADQVDQLSKQIADKIIGALDAADFCQLFYSNTFEKLSPKSRRFDRVIVRVFEVSYTMLLEESGGGRDLASRFPDFFSIVPRGECLDIFLAVLKESCLGNDEVADYSLQLEQLLSDYIVDEVVHWNEFYRSPEFEPYIESLFGRVLGRMRKGEHPLPALVNRIPERYHPERINRLLRHILRRGGDKAVLRVADEPEYHI